MREALRKAEISQRAASDKTGIPMSTLTRSMAGHSPFDVDQLAVIAELVGATLPDLVASETDETDDPAAESAGAA